jgi:hypothetical protein
VSTIFKQTWQTVLFIKKIVFLKETSEILGMLEKQMKANRQIEIILINDLNTFLWFLINYPFSLEI